MGPDVIVMLRDAISLEDVRRWEPESQWPGIEARMREKLGKHTELTIADVLDYPAPADYLQWLVVREEILDIDTIQAHSVECADRVCEYYTKLHGDELWDRGTAESALEAVQRAIPADRVQHYLTPADMLDGEIEWRRQRAAHEASQSLYAALSEPVTRATAEMARLCACRACGWAASPLSAASAWTRESERQLELLRERLFDAKRPRRLRHRGIRIRLARNSDGERIQELCREAGHWQDWMVWDELAPYWLIAERRGEVVGTLMYSPGRPLARAEFMAIDPGVSHSIRAIAVRQLLFAANIQARREGSSGLVGHVPFALKGYARVLRRWGCESIGQGHLMVKRNV